MVNDRIVDLHWCSGFTEDSKDRIGYLDKSHNKGHYICKCLFVNPYARWIIPVTLIKNNLRNMFGVVPYSETKWNWHTCLFEFGLMLARSMQWYSADKISTLEYTVKITMAYEGAWLSSSSELILDEKSHSEYEKASVTKTLLQRGNNYLIHTSLLILQNGLETYRSHLLGPHQITEHWLKYVLRPNTGAENGGG